MAGAAPAARRNESQRKTKKGEQREKTAARPARCVAHCGCPLRHRRDLIMARPPARRKQQAWVPALLV
jgi:hypothetical protein